MSVRLRAGSSGILWCVVTSRGLYGARHQTNALLCVDAARHLFHSQRVRLPIQYSLRNVFVRWRSTIATVLGIALVVLVWIIMQALAAGLETAGGTTGDPRNLLVVRKGSDSESTSQIGLDDLRSIQYSEEIARDERNRPLISADTLVTAYLPRAGGAEGVKTCHPGQRARAAGEVRAGMTNLHDQDSGNLL